MSTSEKALSLLKRVHGDADLAQDYMWFINLLERAATNTLSEENAATLKSELPRFKGGKLRIDAEIDALLETFRPMAISNRH